MKTLWVFLMMISVPAGAGCESAKSAAGDTCSDQAYAPIKAKVDAILNQYKDCQGSLTGSGPLSGSGCAGSSEIAQARSEYAQAKLENDQFLKKCSQAIDVCSQSCQAEMKEMIKAIQASENKRFCEQEEPSENKKSSEQNSSTLASALSALAQLLAALGMSSTETSATESTCATDTTLCTTTDTASTVASDTATLDSARSVEESSLEGTGDLSGATGVASGSPAEVQLSSAIAGNAGGLPAASVGGGASGSSPRGREGEAEKSSSALMATASGSGGGGSLAGQGKSATGAQAGPPTRVSLEQDRQMQAAIQKAASQRGLASEENFGGITSAHSFDNFQKVERRMESERNNLNER